MKPCRCCLCIHAAAPWRHLHAAPQHPRPADGQAAPRAPPALRTLLPAPCFPHPRRLRTLHPRRPLPPTPCTLNPGRPRSPHPAAQAPSDSRTPHPPPPRRVRIARRHVRRLSVPGPRTPGRGPQGPGRESRGPSRALGPGAAAPRDRPRTARPLTSARARGRGVPAAHGPAGCRSGSRRGPGQRPSRAGQGPRGRRGAAGPGGAGRGRGARTVRRPRPRPRCPSDPPVASATAPPANAQPPGRSSAADWWPGGGRGGAAAGRAAGSPTGPPGSPCFPASGDGRSRGAPGP